MSTSLERRIAVAPDVMFRPVGEEAVLLHLKHETYLGLDPVGTRMWTLLTESQSIESAYEVLLTEYDVDEGQLRRDLDDFINTLVEHDLVQVDSSEALVSGD
jgi:hypothetical protein